MYNILIVDDEKIICDSLKIKILSCGIELIGNIQIAHSGEEGLQYLEKQDFQIVFTDIKMSKMSGIDLVKKSIERGYLGKFIVLSGYDDYCYVREAFRLGALDYLLKPVSTEEIHEKLISTIKSIENEKKLRDNIQWSDNHIFQNKLKEYILNPLSKSEFIRGFAYPYLNFGMFICNGDRRPGGICEKIEEEWKNVKNTFWKDNKLQPSEVWITDQKYVIMFNYQEEDEFKKFQETIQNCLTNLMGLLGKNENSSAVWAVICQPTNCRQANEQIEKLNQAYKYRIFSPSCSLIQTEEKKRDEEILSEIEKRELYEHDEEERINLMNKQVIAKFSLSVIRVYTIERIKQLWDFYMELIKELYRKILYIDFCDEYTFEQFDSFSQMRNYLLEKIYNLRKDCYNFWKRQRTVGEIAKEYVKENYTKEIDMSVVANMVSMNYSYFSEVFKKETGITFREYIMKTRLEEAKRLLRNPTVKITEIAERIGYDNSKNFSRAFHKFTGLSPREYRKKYKEDFY